MEKEYFLGMATDTGTKGDVTSRKREATPKRRCHQKGRRSIPLASAAALGCECGGVWVSSMAANPDQKAIATSW